MTDSRSRGLRMIVGKATFFACFGKFRICVLEMMMACCINTVQQTFLKTNDIQPSSRLSKHRPGSYQHHRQPHSDIGSCVTQSNSIHLRKDQNEPMGPLLSSCINMFPANVSYWTWWKHENGSSAVRRDSRCINYQCIVQFCIMKNSYYWMRPCAHVDSHLPGCGSSDEKYLQGMAQSCYKSGIH